VLATLWPKYIYIYMSVVVISYIAHLLISYIGVDSGEEHPVHPFSMEEAGRNLTLRLEVWLAG
jgi:hypothetical protein